MSLGADYFEGVYAEGDDPWGFRDRWYEQRKRDLTLAALPEARYERGFEPGCAIGVLTERLADRCAALLSTDVNATAVAAARRRLAGAAHVQVEQGVVPADWPAGTFDLIVLSEVGYYLTGADLDALGRLAATSLRPGGTLLACHWRHEVADYPTGGDEVHEMIAAQPGLQLLVRHLEDDLRLEVFSDDGRSVARRSGLRS